jgi:hypothetical protein
MAAVVIVGLLTLSCETTPSERNSMAFYAGDIQTLAMYDQWNAVLSLLNSGKYKDIDALNTRKSYGDYTITHGRTALMSAAANGRLDVVQALVARGANVNLRITADSPTKGKTASALAYDAGHINIVEYLKANGAIDFDQVQQFQVQQQGGSAAGAVASPSQRTYTVIVWYTSSGTRMSAVYPIQASSKDEAERDARRQWQTQFGWNTALQFIEAIAQ